MTDDLDIEDEEEEWSNRLEMLRQQRINLKNQLREESSSNDAESVEMNAEPLSMSKFSSSTDKKDLPSQNYCSEEDLEEGEIPKWCLDMMEKKTTENSSDSEILEPCIEPKPDCSTATKVSKLVVDQNMEPQRNKPAIKIAVNELRIAASEKKKFLMDNQIEYCGEVCIPDVQRGIDLQMTTDRISILPKPTLRCTIKDQKDIQLSWSHSDLPTNSSKILHYELFVNIPQREPISEACIRKIQPLRLPMACTLNCIVKNIQYYFAVRYFCENGTVGPLSDKIG
uniref:Fibronectin type-III domain-containing protein n=1 Tax=Romanomermis culicivorax TaxID=13658 RepID=A0A915I6B8_ROMCU